jgi:hypothetical protein
VVGAGDESAILREQAPSGLDDRPVHRTRSWLELVADAEQLVGGGGKRQDDEGDHDDAGDRRAVGVAGAAGAKAVDQKTGLRRATRSAAAGSDATE